MWFSTCPADTPDWRIRARSIDIDPKTRNGTGRDAAVEFMGVPILYLPWISFPIGSQRKSGFLFPNVGYGSRSGLQLELPYYFDLAPNRDLTLEPVLYGRRGLEFGGRFRYLTAEHRGELQARLLPSDRIKDADRHFLRLAHRGGFGDAWRVEVDAQDVSDAEYFEDFGSGVADASTTFLPRLARATWTDGDWMLRGELRDFQVIDRALATEDRPYATLPRIVLGGDFGRGAARRLRWGLDSEIVRFDRDTGVTGWRLDVAPRASLDIDRSGWFLRPGASWRYTGYDLSDAVGPSKPSRSLPSAWFDAGLRLERLASSGGAARITLEPRMLYLWTPYRDQDALPVFDTAAPDLDYVQLFRTTRYVGADRVGDADQLSLGVTTRIYDASGRQLLWATVGQTRYFEPPRVRLPWEPAARRHGSDLVAQLGVSAWRDWSVDLGLQWNTRDERRERSDLRVRWRPDDDRALNFAWNFQHGGIDQAEFSGAWPIGKRWGVFGKMVYDREGKAGLERFAGFEYKACCWRLRAVGRRFVSNRTGAQDTQFYLQLELNGLSSVGSNADAFLEEAIRGYSRAGASR
ncbi:MAG: LPS-assembly protein LptD [Gammaproteobacteria bacterium]|nr:LPS-assembly protein LptD [Gammaproteobacteria bacterium]